MPITGPRIVRNMRDFISRNGDDWANWYIGIAVDPSDRLVDDHKVDIGSDLWVCSEAFTPEEALLIKGRFVDEHGVDSDDARDEKQGRFVYAYKKAPHTKP
ncbi:MAG: hypothetical protein AB7D06_04125 [Pedobacter sp.]